MPPSNPDNIKNYYVNLMLNFTRVANATTVYN